MASKRNLKKMVRYMCGDMAAECIIAKNNVAGVDANVMHELVVEIARMQEGTLSKMTFGYDKVAADFDSPKAYKKARHEYVAKAFKSLKAEFNQKVNAIVKDMNAALPQAQKDLNKQN